MFKNKKQPLSGYSKFWQVNSSFTKYIRLPMKHFHKICYTDKKAQTVSWLLRNHLYILFLIVSQYILYSFD